MLYFTLKALHLAAVCLWFGALFVVFGLLSRLSALHRRGALPTGTAQRSAATRLWRDVASPAAALAVLFGVLLMLNGQASAWVAAKLLAVTGLVLLHVGAGAWLQGLQRRGMPAALPRWLGGALAILLLLLFLTIAVVSGAKPDWASRASIYSAASFNRAITRTVHHPHYVHRDLRGGGLSAFP